MIAPTDVQRVTEMVEDALESGEIVGDAVLDVFVVPDTVMIEGVANGHQIPLTWRVLRADGRTAWLFRGGAR